MNYKYYLKVGINSRNSVVYVKKKRKKKEKSTLKKFSNRVLNQTLNSAVEKY